MFGVAEYETTKANKMGNHTSSKISKDTTSNLSREEKGVVSSVFAKVIDAKICKKGNNNDTSAGKCHYTSDTAAALSKVFSSENSNYYGNGKETEKVTTHTSGVISKDTAELSREEKGVVSSVFAKVIEGAEIL